MRMTTTTDGPRTSAGDRRRNATYLKEFLPGMVLYMISIVVVSIVVGDEPSGADRLVALLPLLPSVWVAWAVVRMIRRSDEMTRALHHRAMAVGFGAAMLTAMATGLLAIPGDTGMFGQLTPWLIFAVGLLAWAVATAVLTLRQS